MVGTEPSAENAGNPTRVKCLPASVERTSTRHQPLLQRCSPSTQRLRAPTAAALSGLNPCGTPRAVPRPYAAVATTATTPARTRASANRIDRRLLRPTRLFLFARRLFAVVARRDDLLGRHRHL